MSYGRSVIKHHEGNFLRTLSIMRGIQKNIPLAPLTWFRTGGMADFFFTPPTLKDLQVFLKECPNHVPRFVLGAGSNTLVRDGGFKGIVISLRHAGQFLMVNGDNTIDVGAAVLDKKLAKKACDAGIGGFSFLYTIPGTIGGALRMNAGAFGSEIKDILVYAIAMNPRGQIHYLTPNDMMFAYRSSGMPEDWIFLGARLRGYKKPSKDILQEIEKLSQKRRDTQPAGRTGGSTFKNPLPQKAWELIERAGLRGKNIGDACFSEKHCNFILNKGGARAADIEGLGNLAQETVKEKTGTQLEWEIKRIGEVLRRS